MIFKAQICCQQPVP